MNAARNILSVYVSLWPARDGGPPLSGGAGSPPVEKPDALECGRLSPRACWCVTPIRTLHWQQGKEMELLSKGDQRRVLRGQVPLMSPKMRKALLDVLRRIHDTGLEYSVVGGVMLGLARSGSFIPWDNDGDVCVPLDMWDEMLLRLVGDDESGFVVAPGLLGAQVYFHRSPEAVVDVYPVARLPIDGRWAYAAPLRLGATGAARASFGVHTVYPRDLFPEGVLFPSTVYSFEGMEVRGPRDLTEACRVSYGEGCCTEARLPEVPVVPHGSVAAKAFFRDEHGILRAFLFLMDNSPVASAMNSAMAKIGVGQKPEDFLLDPVWWKAIHAQRLSRTAAPFPPPRGHVAAR